MTQVNANVTPSKVFVKDGNGEALVTVEDLNLLGAPAVTVDLGGQVAIDDLAAGAVSAAKLADALADMLRTAVATVGTEATNAVTVTIQVKDAQGNNVGEKCVFAWWLSDAAAGAPTATIPDVGLSVTTGVNVKTLTASEVSRVMTDAAGVAVLVLTETGALTRYFNMVLLNDLIAGSQALVWTT